MDRYYVSGINVRALTAGDGILKSSEQLLYYQWRFPSRFSLQFLQAKLRSESELTLHPQVQLEGQGGRGGEPVGRNEMTENTVRIAHNP